MPRFHCPVELVSGAEISLPPGAARHVQVLRLQPGNAITLFSGGTQGPGGEYDATVLHMGRSDVRVRVGVHHAIEREAMKTVHLLAGITANERMDWLVEKATELGVASITALAAERSVLRLKGERADKKIAHWQAVAVAACEQCGRNRIPMVRHGGDIAQEMQMPYAMGSMQHKDHVAPRRLLLSLRPDSQPLHAAAPGQAPVVLLSGPEGGLSKDEEDLALQTGFIPVTLGPRVLRAETAPLAALAALLLA